MAFSYGINQYTVAGKLSKNPVIKKLPNSGKPFAEISIPTTTVVKGREITEWHNIVVYGEPTVLYIERNVKKRTVVYCQGEKRTRKWEDKSGSKRETTELVINPFDGIFKILEMAPDQKDQTKQVSPTKGPQQNTPIERKSGFESNGNEFEDSAFPDEFGTSFSDPAKH